MSSKTMLLFILIFLSGCVTVNNDNIVKFTNTELCDFLNPLLYGSVVLREKGVVCVEIKHRGISCLCAGD